MSTADRIAALRAEGEAAVAAAASTAELEEARVRFLGRKAELPNLLRDVGKLPPEERGAVGKGANQARQALQAAVDARLARAGGAGVGERGSRPTWSTSRCPARRSTPAGHLHILTATRREIEDVFVGLGFRVVEGPEIDLAYYNFDALNHDEHHPARAPSDTFYVADDVVLRTQTSPMQVRTMELGPPPLYIIVPGRVYRPDNDATHTPQFHQVEGLAVDEDLTLGDLQGTLLAFARAIFGDDRDVRLRPHFFPFTEPRVELDVSCFNCKQGFLRDGSRCPLCKGTAWIEILGAGMVDPNLYSLRARVRLRRRPPPGLRLGHGDRADRLPQARRARPAHVLRERPSTSGAIRMRLPLFWLTDYVDPGLEASKLATRLAMTGTEVDRIHTHGVTALDYFVVGRVLARRAAPGRGPADGLPRVHGRGRRGADRLRGAERRRGPDGRRRPARRGDARRHAPEALQAARRRVPGHDPGRGRGRDRHRSRRDHGPRRRAPGRDAAGRRAADRHRRARARDHAQPARLPVDLRRRARGARRHGRAVGAAAVGGRPRV